jgi:FMN reductase
MAFRIVGLTGSLSVSSKTRTLVDLALLQLTTRFDVMSASYDLTDLQPSLGLASRLEDLEPLPAQIIRSMITADALILGVPVYKGSYPGLFKHVFDLIDPEALRSKPVLLTATGGGERHALVIEHQLRPLMGFFEAAALPTGLYASGADYTDGVPTSPALLARLERAIEQFVPSIGAGARLTHAA